MNKTITNNICDTICEEIALIDKRPIDHGERTAYILYKMLQYAGEYEAYEIAEFCFIAKLHDIGAYITEDLNSSLRYEYKESVRHSVAGFLFFKYLTPYEKLAKIILYHHSDYNQTENIQYKYKDIAMFLHVAETTDIYQKAMGSTFSLDILNKYAGIKYSKRSLNLLKEAQEKEGILQKLSDGSYLEELEKSQKYLLLNKEDRKKLLRMMMYCMEFYGELASVDVVTCVAICEELAKKLTLSEEDANILYYAAVVHDLGMLSIPKEIINLPRKLQKDEIELVRSHVQKTQDVIEGKFNTEIVRTALAHHERLDGSGYPKGLHGEQMTYPMVILQVADMATGLLGKRTFRKSLEIQDVCLVLQNEVKRGKLQSHVVDTFVENAIEIMTNVEEHKKKIYGLHDKMYQQYDQTLGVEREKKNR